MHQDFSRAIIPNSNNEVENVWSENNRIESNESLAERLGIAPEELDKLFYDIVAEESNDGLIYCYRIEFFEDCPLYILEKIIGLESGNIVRVPPETFDYQGYDYQEQFDAVSDNKSPYDNFLEEVENLKILIDLPVDSDVQRILYRQIFISIIGLMETFLSDTFINETMGEESFFKNFVRTHPEFRKRKFELRDIFEESANLRESAKMIMLDMIYHKLPDVREMYREAFKINFPPIRTMLGYVRDRHDLVHRSGKRKDGSFLEVDRSLLHTLINDATLFVKQIEDEIYYSYMDIPF